MNEVVITGSEITLQQIVNVARQGAKVLLSARAKKNIIQSRQVIDRLVEDSKIVYGVTTGFGMFSETFIEKEFTNSLQKNLIVSHAVGAGDFLKMKSYERLCCCEQTILQKGIRGYVWKRYKRWWIC